MVWCFRLLGSGDGWVSGGEGESEDGAVAVVRSVEGEA
jgi:hypothetical protein